MIRCTPCAVASDSTRPPKFSPGSSFTCLPLAPSSTPTHPRIPLSIPSNASAQMHVRKQARWHADMHEPPALPSPPWFSFPFPYTPGPTLLSLGLSSAAALGARTRAGAGRATAAAGGGGQGNGHHARGGHRAVASARARARAPRSCPDAGRVGPGRASAERSSTGAGRPCHSSTARAGRGARRSSGAAYLAAATPAPQSTSYCVKSPRSHIVTAKLLFGCTRGPTLTHKTHDKSVGSAARLEQLHKSTWPP